MKQPPSRFAVVSDRNSPADATAASERLFGRVKVESRSSQGLRTQDMQRGLKLSVLKLIFTLSLILSRHEIGWNRNWDRTETQAIDLTIRCQTNSIIELEVRNQGHRASKQHYSWIVHAPWVPNRSRNDTKRVEWRLGVVIRSRSRNGSHSSFTLVWHRLSQYCR